MNIRMESSTDLVEMLGLQLSEVEMLACMFPNSGEFVMDDPLAVSDVQQFVDGDVKYDNLSSRIGFIVKLKLGEADKVHHAPC